MIARTRRELLAGLTMLAPGCRRRPTSRLSVGSSTARREVFAELVARQLERRLGTRVATLPDLGGGLAAHEALLAGRVDASVECTGFALISILQRPFESRPEVVLERVRLEYGNRFRLRWMDPLGFEDGFVLVVRRETAERHALSSLSEAERLSPGWQLAVPGEFLTRPDGMAALMKTYSLRLRSGPLTVPPAAACQALREGKVTLVAARAADGELLAADLFVLEDDRRAFPPNQAALVVREEALTRHTGMEAALAELTGRISLEQARRLNAEAAARGPAAVAAAFLRERL
ncbi:MAG: hypothetical protein NZ554_07935 [Bryobacteraceae bacterium]|nr:hypothetical protein [Bryobacteraceae bacterium]